MTCQWCSSDACHVIIPQSSNGCVFTARVCVAAVHRGGLPWPACVAHVISHETDLGVYSGLGHESLQFTLVDCPGHASLVRTIIAGAQIIDLMLLVIDVTKGRSESKEEN